MTLSNPLIKAVIFVATFLGAAGAINQIWAGPDRNVALMVGSVIVFLISIFLLLRSEDVV